MLSTEIRERLFTYTFGSSDPPSDIPKRCQVVALDVDAVQPSEIAGQVMMPQGHTYAGDFGRVRAEKGRPRF